MPVINKRETRRYDVPWGYRRSILGKDANELTEIVEIDMEKGQKTKLHYHEKIVEMFYLVKGNATVYVDDITYKLSEGDFLIVSPYEKHKIVAEDTGAKILAVKSPGMEEDRIFLE